MIGSIFLLVILILLNAVFASAEIAVLSMNEAKLKLLTEQGNKKAIKLTKLTRQPARFLATIQVAITLAGFLSSAFAADYFAEPLVSMLLQAGIPVPVKVLNSLSVIVITILLSYFSLVFGELVPKRIAMKKAESPAPPPPSSPRSSVQGHCPFGFSFNRVHQRRFKAFGHQPGGNRGTGYRRRNPHDAL